MQPKFQAVMFDLDGTLVDSLGDFHHAASTMLDTFGFKAIPKQEVGSFVGNGQDVFIARCLVHAGAKLTTSELVKATQIFEAAYDGTNGQYTKKYPGVDEVLKNLQSSGVKIALCTNRPIKRAHSILKSVGLDQYFDVIAGFESSILPKPDPGPLNYCLNKLNVKPHAALFVGDSHVDAEAAKRANVRFAFHSGGLGGLNEEPAAHVFANYASAAKFMSNKIKTISQT